MAFLHKYYTYFSKFCSDEETQKFVELLPEVFDTQGQLVHHGRNDVRLFELPSGKRLAVKRFGKPKWLQLLGTMIFRKGKAHAAFFNTLRLREFGIQSPLPLAYSEVWSYGALRHSFLVTECTELTPLSTAFYLTEPFDKCLAVDFATFVAHLHGLGVFHHDLNQTNVLVDLEKRGIERFSLIDNNRITFFDCKKNVDETAVFENLTRFTGDYNLFDFVADAYVDAARRPNSDAAKLKAQKRRHDHRWKLRKRITHPLRTLRQDHQKC